MRMSDIILKKRLKGCLSTEEIDFFISNYTDGTIPDYQASALAMAIVLNGMDSKETSDLTNAMMNSGEIVHLDSIKGIKVDKHSTGGVGDKTSLVLGPLVASLGAPVAKMSGRGLGHTGGTLDKMEAIPGMNISLSEQQFIDQVNKIGIAIMGQTASLVPADKKLYALRDVTATVDSIPLIASSIMSKKLATGADAICLDVKFGSGAFCKTLEEAEKLARAMVDIGTHLNRNTKAILTDMEQPLGMTIGNILEVKEAVQTLKGNGPKDLVDLCLSAGAIMLVQAKIYTDTNVARQALQAQINNGQGYLKLREFIAAQGGDVTYLDDLEKFEVAKYQVPVIAKKSGFLHRIDAMSLGIGAMKVGAGRLTYDDIIDYTAGIVLNHKVGDRIEVGELLCTVHSNLLNIDPIINEISNAFEIGAEKIEILPIIRQIIA